MSGFGACWESACACVQLGLGWESPNQGCRGRAVPSALWTEMGMGGCPASKSVLPDRCLPSRLRLRLLMAGRSQLQCQHSELQQWDGSAHLVFLLWRWRCQPCV